MSNLPASPKQIKFLESLAYRHDIPGMSYDDATTYLTTVISAGALTRKLASDLIEEWKAAPRREVVEQVPPGYYVHGDEYYVVVESKKNPGRNYAKRFDQERHVWVYAPGGISTLSLDKSEPLTIEEAARYGHLHGRCLICARPLTDPDSVSAGIGPICRRRLGK